MPFAAPWRWYPSLVQLSRDGLDGDITRFSKLTNCRAKGLSSHVRDPPARQSIVDPVLSRREQIQAPKHPQYGIAMPPTAAGRWYPPSVQFTCEPTMGNEACRYEHSNGREQSEGAGVCGPLARQRAAYPVPAGWSSLTCLFHWAIMAGS
ncbi:MAG: hypothetical protein QOJ15_1657 [Bradyrhizobium sp.]|nr:hypothetical protein [Bradyrhizobium sp.]